MTVTVDTTAYTADATWPSADGFIPANIVFAEVAEPVGGHVTADSTAYTADNTTWPTADGGVLGGASDLIDATRIAAAGAGFWVDHIGRRRPVVGVGFAILPSLKGLSVGTVGVAGAGAAVPPISGSATGEAGDDDLLVMLLLLAA